MRGLYCTMTPDALAPYVAMAHFLSLARSKLRLCSANHRPGYWSNLPCDWPSTAWAYSKLETENGPSSSAAMVLTMPDNLCLPWGGFQQPVLRNDTKCKNTWMLYKKMSGRQGYKQGGKNDKTLTFSIPYNQIISRLVKEGLGSDGLFCCQDGFLDILVGNLHSTCSTPGSTLGFWRKQSNSTAVVIQHNDNDFYDMMTSWNGNAFHITLCEGNLTVTYGFPSQRSSNAEHPVFTLLLAWTTCAMISQVTGDFRHHNTWVTIVVMSLYWRGINLQCVGTKLLQFNIVNIMVADVMSMWSKGINIDVKFWT